MSLRNLRLPVPMFPSSAYRQDPSTSVPADEAARLRPGRRIAVLVVIIVVVVVVQPAGHAFTETLTTLLTAAAAAIEIITWVGGQSDGQPNPGRLS